MRSFSNELLSFDPNTGAATSIATLNFSGVTGMAYDATNDVLYGAGCPVHAQHVQVYLHNTRNGVYGQDYKAPFDTGSSGTLRTQKNTEPERIGLCGLRSG